jgi:iron complex outermembrane receptor protein
MRHPGLIFAVVLLAGVTGLSDAQEAAPPDSVVGALPEIVVTGTRVPGSIQKTPAAVTVVERKDFIDSRLISLKDALSEVPGVFVQTRGGAQDVRITIRGYGARGNGERSNSGNIRGIRILTDGIPISEPDGRTSLDLADLGSADRVEVVRSNSSALYGNASGGVINLRTNLDFNAPFTELRFRGGSFGFHREQVLTGFALGQSRGTLSVATSDFDGWRSHSGSSITLGQLRLTSPLDSKTRLGVLLDAVSNLNRYPGPLTRAQADSAPDQANARFTSRDERRENKVGRAAVSFDRELTTNQNMTASVFVEPKVLARSERNRYRDFNRYHLGGSALWNWRPHLSEPWTSGITVGGDEAYQDGSILFYNLSPDGGRGPTTISNKREAAQSGGAFLQGVLTWNERWSGQVAARYDAIHYISQDRIDPSLNDDKTFIRWTPKASLAYLAGAHTVYGSLGGGVEAPAFNEIDPPAPFDTLTSFNPFLKSTYSTTWELGGRGKLDFGRFKYDVALYWIDARNDLVPFDGGAYFFTAGKSRRKGVEAGLEWQVAHRLTARGMMTVSKNEYVEYMNDLGDFAGKEVAGLPGEIATGSLEYRLPEGISAEVGAEYVGAYFADDANAAEAPDYVVLNAKVGATRLIDGHPVRAFAAVNNLTDKEHTASVFINGLNNEFFEPGLPRNWSFGLTIGL